MAVGKNQGTEIQAIKHLWIIMTEKLKTALSKYDGQISVKSGNDFSIENTRIFQRKHKNT